MALPFLPGQVFDRKIGKTKFHKTHQFDYRNDVSVYVGEDKCGIGGDPLPGQKLKPRHSAYPKGIGPEAPAWVAFDRQVLCFDAYFQEAVHEKREEQYRIRRCKIYFYLEDDSIQVIEPKVNNSGIPQGTLIRRHRVPLPPPNDEEFYTVENFNVGQEITLYSRTFKITGCDDFTHNFLRKLGVRIGNQNNIPSDPYTEHRKKEVESMQPLRPYETEDTLRQFLQFDRNVLRFYCLWDDCDNMFGDVREMELHYFLADDTVEICERIPNNSGRDAVPMFLRRQKLPKEPTSLRQPGEITGRTVLNVFGPMGHGGRWILDSLKTGAVHTDYYHDSDLTIGSVINVWGRKFLICDCDEFTKEYYKSKYGVGDFESISFKADPVSLPVREIPPYNGFGSEEDSLATCLSLRPKPTRRDFKKFMEKDRKGLESNVLRFVARLDTTRPIDTDRRFIISYFLSDDTLLVFEPLQRNSGILGGKFMERGRIKKPDGVNYFAAQDLYIGANVDFHNFKFILIDADEYAVVYMEKHAPEFPQANVQIILPKLKPILDQKYEEIKREFQAFDIENTGKIPAKNFREILQRFGQGILTVHEQLTVARHYGDVQVEEDDFQLLVVAIQEQLRKANFEDFANMMDSCKHEDVLGTGFLPLQELHNTCRRFGVPAKQDLLRALLEKVERNDKGEANYQHFLQLLNWRDSPVSSQKFVPAAAPDPKSVKRTGPQELPTLVCYKDLLQNLLAVE
ncbi:EF-hand domain-containing family member C2-like [Acropora millepora]|uniref:EF-hand domain-containing family member C2-like n=1 Tax=Acropora millepora TaxID=45264 RepID=UPI001CF3A3CD|nr:EF-hand domain-containing family member C2-like [Acropora millepora]